MSLIQIQWNPTPRQLRQFGLISALALPGLGWLLTRPGGWLATGLASGEAALSRPMLVAVLAAVGLSAAVLSFVYPRAVKPLFVGLSLVTMPIGLVVSELVLLLVYLGVITPIGLVFRLAGRDVLGRRLDRATSTYWQPAPAAPEATRYYRQF